MPSLIKMCVHTVKVSFGAALALAIICFALATHASSAENRRWSFSAAFEAPVATDCVECGDDIGMMLRCTSTGQAAEVTVHWAAVEQGTEGQVLPITFTIAGRKYVYQATTKEYGQIGFTPEFNLPPNDPLIEALQAGDKAKVNFSGGTTAIDLKGARDALTAFKAHCKWPDSALSIPVGDDNLVWQHFTYNDEGNKGRYTARLTYQVPETDNIQFEALCVAGSSGTEIQVTIGYDVAGRSDGENVKLKIEAGVYKATHSAEIYGTQLEVGISGALLYVELSNPFWQALASGQATMTYSIAGGTKATMKLNGSGKPVSAFIGNCRKIQQK